MAPRVRAATFADVDSLLRMMQSFNAFERIPWKREAAEPALRTLLADPSLGVVGLVEADGAALGYFVVTWSFDLEWNGRDAFLTELFVVEAARGRGLGKAALRAAEALAVQSGAGALHLMVRHENERAHRLYLGAGYSSPPRVFLTKPLSGVNAPAR